MSEPVDASGGGPPGGPGVGPPAEPAGPGRPAEAGSGGRLRPAFEHGLVVSRGLTLIPVVMLVMAAAGAFVYGTALFVHSAREVIADPFPVGNKIGQFLIVIDLFLVGATLLIAAFGFYELFINPALVAGRRAHLPRWLVMNDLNDLKARIVSMLVLVTATSFVDVVVDFHGGQDIIFLGAAVALVIAALTAFQRFGAGGRDGR